MPDPGPSSRLPSPAASATRFGAPALGLGTRAVGAGPSTLPVTTAAPAPVAAPLGAADAGRILERLRENAGRTPPARTPARTADPSPGRILHGPTGLGTAGLYLGRREEPPAEPPAAAEPSASVASVESVAAVGNPIPGLYYHPVPEPDAARAQEISRRIKAWAVDEVQLYPPELEDQFDGFSVGRYMVACHPDAPTVDHLMIATRLMAAENAVDDYYCEDHGGSPVGLGGRLLLAHTALDPLFTTTEYQPQWAQSLLSDAPRRAYRSAMEYFVQKAGPSQADRFRHDMARLHLGYLAEAAWAETDYVPQVWEYLAMRQFNNFRPCPTITDTVGGYELPADLHAQPGMQRVIALAGNATTIVNDLYSYTKELASPGRHLNLPVVIAEREGRSERDAYLKAVEVHNDLMHAFEAAAAELAAACPLPVVLRFLRGVAAWVDGNHYWHQTNTFRYSLPDFW